jgi:hypothetical protein
MDIENPYLPCDKQDIDKNPYQDCIDYLSYGVNEGYISEEYAEELIADEDWDTVYGMMEAEDEYTDSDMEQDEKDRNISR